MCVSVLFLCMFSFYGVHIDVCVFEKSAEKQPVKLSGFAFVIVDFMVIFLSIPNYFSDTSLTYLLPHFFYALSVYV